MHHAKIVYPCTIIFKILTSFTFLTLIVLITVIRALETGVHFNMKKIEDDIIIAQNYKQVFSVILNFEQRCHQTNCRHCFLENLFHNQSNNYFKHVTVLFIYCTDNS